MTKLMAPNIRIDWYPEEHFQDIHNPTVVELNSGVNLSCAVVSGFTLDFADPDTVQITGVLNDTISQVVNRSVYEANLQFFLAPRGSSSENERAFRDAERLFYNQHNNIGYLVKRVGYLSHVEYGEVNDQHVDIFKVQADVPKVLSEDGEPILLDVRFIPQGEAASAVVIPEFLPPDTYMWFNEPGNSDSIYVGSSGRITKRNYMPDPSFEYGNLSQISTGNLVGYGIVEHSNAPYGTKVLHVVPDPSRPNPPQVAFRPKDNDSFRSKWLSFSLNIRLSSTGTARAHMYIGYDSSRETIDTYISDEWVNIKLPPTELPSGASNIRVVLFLYDDSGTNTYLDSSHEVLIDGLQMVQGNSAEDVESQLVDYFDGDGNQPYPPKIEYAWLGEPHNSPSVKLADGVEVARNLATNLAVTSLDGFVAQGIVTQNDLEYTGQAVRMPVVSQGAHGLTIPGRNSTNTGEMYTMSLHMRANRELPLQLRIGGTEVTAEPLSTEWQWHTVRLEAGSYTHTGLVLRSGHDIGDWVEVDRVLLSAADVDYFDGDTL